MATRVGYVGVGAMGLAMAGHTAKAGFDVIVHDIDAEKLRQAEAEGLKVTGSLVELGGAADVFVLIVATDQQVIDVTKALAETVSPGSVIAVAATNNPGTMKSLADYCGERDIGFIDAPVVNGAQGAREGNLLSLCGGAKEHVEKARPVLASYGRDVLHVGGIGLGQIAKACNNLLHWIHCVGN